MDINIMKYRAPYTCPGPSMARWTHVLVFEVPARNAGVSGSTHRRITYSSVSVTSILRSEYFWQSPCLDLKFQLDI